MHFRIKYKKNGKTEEIEIDVDISLKSMFGVPEAAAKLGLKQSEIIRVTKVS